jgi:hypothetical protein
MVIKPHIFFVLMPTHIFIQVSVKMGTLSTLFYMYITCILPTQTLYDHPEQGLVVVFKTKSWLQALRAMIRLHDYIAVFALLNQINLCGLIHVN